ncbi:MAG: SDR family NAD(P)-dependent oxidoreductase [Thermoplasmata archaeon]|nr:SDR family NAD(P)-dependent oxidoreductase [Thermoplasmata archaeon]
MSSLPGPGPGRPFAGAGAIVTGASRGIGAAIARALAREGVHLLLVARNADRLSTVQSEIASAGGTAAALAQDLTAPEAAERVVQVARERLEAPYLLVNNAGIATAQRFDRRPPGEWEQELVTNLVAPLRLTYAFLPTLLRAGRGHVIFTGSATADRPLPRLAVYSATKAALRGFGRALDLELVRRGVRVSVVEPVYVRTELGRRPTDVEAPLERRAREHPRSALEPEVVACAVVRLLYHPRPVVHVPWTWAASRGALNALDPILQRRWRLPPPTAGPSA